MKYKVPTRTHVRNVKLPALFDAERKKVKDAMLPVTSVCLTTDMWTSRNYHGFIAVMSHYWSDDEA